MRSICAGSLCVIILGLLTLGALGEAARTPPPQEIREAAGPAVCLVSAEGPLGLQVARVNGFLLGGGKFVVTDLAAVAQPGVARVTLTFRDGSTSAVKEFGLADPAIGLVLLKVEEPKAGATGLSLSTVPTSSGPTDALLFGWKQSQDPNMVRVRIYSGITSGDLAARLKVDPPKTAVTFYGIEGLRPDMLSGAPVLDAEGGVAGVLLQMPGADHTIVMPAGALRNALLAAEPTTKPLASLPTPLWPTMTLAVGKPITGADFATAVRTIRSKSRCTKCGGKGSISVERNVGSSLRPSFRTETSTCSACNGEGVICPDGLYNLAVTVAEGAVWLQTAPEVDPKLRAVAATSGRELLAGLAKVGPHYRAAFVKQVEADFTKTADQWPHGMIDYAQVSGTAKGPDGDYTILTAFGPRSLLAVRTDQLTAPAGADGKAVDAPASGEWVLVGGVVEGAVTIAGRHPLLVRPFGWTSGPRLASGGMSPTAGGTEPTTAPPAKAPGAPSFFGL